MKILEIVNQETKIPFIVKISEPGDPYQLPASASGTSGGSYITLDPVIDFYDARYPHTQLTDKLAGQLTGGSYYVATLTKDKKSLMEGGLDLNGGEEDWSIDGNTMKQVFAFIEEHNND